MNIRDYDPSAGFAFQGDVAIVPVPAGMTPSTDDEIAPIDGRLILQAGEMTGHHHAIRLPQPTMFRDDALARELTVASSAPLPSARLYRDPALAQKMVGANILTRADLCVGFLVVENGPMTVTHEEHDGIRLPIGVYYCGRQVESAGAEERKVVD